ncbi:AraC family transcriptional regulator [Enterococcus sp.]|uniref:AraC family transcriptional regulator n=1 Tax=Enterococcus sp. TaxID=35783 RepID=UPI002913BB47|nr:AraC family transcriptional regulator [Enterococcus sp.]MDU5336550.1 AraC family transcriptional regulator [Enterococcus sp.]
MNKNKTISLIRNSISKGTVIDSHFHDWLEFTYILSGEQIVQIQGNEFLISDGDFVMIPYSEIHSFISKKNCSKLTLQIKRDVIEQNIPEFHQSKIECNTTRIQTKENFEDYQELIRYYILLARYFEQDNEIENIAFKSTLLYFFYLLIKNFQKEEDSQQNTAKTCNEEVSIDHILTFIYKHYNENINLKAVSNYFHFSPSYISKLIKKRTQMSFKKYLTETRLNHAQYEVSNTKKRLSDIALEVGFPSNKSFIACFKKKYGKTPSQYRKEISSSN